MPPFSFGVFLYIVYSNLCDIIVNHLLFTFAFVFLTWQEEFFFCYASMCFNGSEHFCILSLYLERNYILARSIEDTQLFWVVWLCTKSLHVTLQRTLSTSLQHS